MKNRKDSRGELEAAGTTPGLYLSSLMLTFFVPDNLAPRHKYCLSIHPPAPGPLQYTKTIGTHPPPGISVHVLSSSRGSMAVLIALTFKTCGDLA